MRRFFVLVAALATSASVLSIANAQQGNARALQARDERIIAAVRAVLDAQVAAWNRGDIERFMDGYRRSPETVFISGDSLTRGWQTVLDRYKKSYDSREKMGTLSFLEIEIVPVNRDTAVAYGRWQLARSEDTPHGRFTLIFRRTREGWRIVHDHTSSAV
ncbi:MAG TPA: nuclear transport factor 2 family protein [Pyrinomonadaceae bacterium]